MKKFLHNGKRYKFVNETTIDGVRYRLFRRTKRVVEVMTETVMVTDGNGGRRVSVIGDARAGWRKIKNRKHHKKKKRAT